MSVQSRNKGKGAERELRRMLSDRLGLVIERDLSAPRDGGYDLTGVGSFALEVKRRERLEIEAWWRQTCEQASHHDLVPALAYRQSRQSWQFLVPIGVFFDNLAPWLEQPRASLGVDGFCLLVREVGS